MITGHNLITLWAVVMLAFVLYWIRREVKR